MNYKRAGGLDTLYVTKFKKFNLMVVRLTSVVTNH